MLVIYDETKFYATKLRTFAINVLKFEIISDKKCQLEVSSSEDAIKILNSLKSYSSKFDRSIYSYIASFDGTDYIFEIIPYNRSLPTIG